jgi:hypothetical protein
MDVGLELPKHVDRYVRVESVESRVDELGQWLLVMNSTTPKVGMTHEEDAVSPGKSFIRIAINANACSRRA